ncbi:uncharacterized protein VTP21DRAFT_469 [Calcarisporiella thermophila]|uniref:uncharacterized protein n=1 Tax=Calcarisporiella thermophila TaxID=911321 RepID=UPI00374484C2
MMRLLENSSMSKSQNHLVKELLTLFPDCDPRYLEHCIGFYNDNHVSRVAEKICNLNYGEYPRIPANATPTMALNSHLERLATELFPDCDITYLRELVSLFPHSHLHQTVEILLEKQRRLPTRLRTGVIEEWEYFRSPEYEKGARHRLYNDFPNTWKSTIRAVMAENNFDYLRSHAKLSELSHNYWWSPFLNFMRRKHQEVCEMWTPELLMQVDILREQERTRLAAADLEFARQLNLDEYQAHSQLIECRCCFGDFPFEDMTFCAEGHLFCVGCIRNLVSEGIFGQGTLRGRPVKCVEGDGCEACIPMSELEKVLLPDMFKAYTNSLVEEEMKHSGLAIVQCAFCIYCEADDNFDPLQSLRLGRALLLAVTGFIAFWIIMVSGLLLIQTVLFLVFVSIFGMEWNWREEFRRAINRVRQKRRGYVFTCRNPDCGKLTCLKCGAECRPLHKCYEKEQDGLRLYVERAMADAVKRTCPKCHVSFQKSDGCNKMVCRCGYIMCYICRKNIRQEGYGHFCDHFRPIPGQKCNKCSKCDLYKVEDESKLVAEAAERARNEYLREHPEARGAEIDLAIGPRTGSQIRAEKMRAALLTLIEWAADYLLI